MLYRIAWFLAQIYTRLLFPTVVVSGLKYINRKGPCILCSNHKTGRDPILLVTNIWRPVSFMSKEELFRNKLSASFYRRLHMFPVKRGASDLHSLRTSLKVLEGGGMLGIYPEGTRYPDAEGVQPLHNGAAMIALRSGAPMVPVYLDSAAGPFKLNRIYAGPPIVVDNREGVVNSRRMKMVTDRLHDAMQALYLQAKQDRLLRENRKKSGQKG
ncbi:MAG: lysophospholipid acyltransferase family protein [Christensenellales bacterium]|jgi:1-acyl-sn-glycerol-3-phosphate acyltransferase